MESFLTTSSGTGAGTGWITAAGWNVPKLLDLSDAVRGHFAERTELGLDCDSLGVVLEMMVMDEEGPLDEVLLPDLQILKDARLDKLLAEMLEAGNAKLMEKFSMETDLAALLQRLWRMRFKGDYFALDKHRYDSLSAGRLRHVSFSSTSLDGMGLWTAKEANKVFETEASMQFEPGQ